MVSGTDRLTLWFSSPATGPANIENGCPLSAIRTPLSIHPVSQVDRLEVGTSQVYSRMKRFAWLKSEGP